MVNTSRPYLSFVLAGLMSSITACSVLAPPKDEVESAPIEGPVETPEPEPEAQDSAPTHTDEEYAKLEAEYLELRDGFTKNQLLLIERETQIQDLNQRIQSMQARINQAIAEVVRAKANMMSAENRAEAASQMAEAEIAIEALGDEVGGSGSEAYKQAEGLIAAATKEFDKQNYGGAMYLASEAKAVISHEQFRLQDRVEVEPTVGEQTFEMPLPLQVTTNSNVREGPGLNFDVVATIEKGTPLTGISYKGKWVRVSLWDGTRGWVYQTLVGGR